MSYHARYVHSGGREYIEYRVLDTTSNKIKLRKSYVFPSHCETPDQRKKWADDMVPLLDIMINAGMVLTELPAHMTAVPAQALEGEDGYQAISPDTAIVPALRMISIQSDLSVSSMRQHDMVLRIMETWMETEKISYTLADMPDGLPDRFLSHVEKTRTASILKTCRSILAALLTKARKSGLTQAHVTHAQVYLPSSEIDLPPDHTATHILADLATADVRLHLIFRLMMYSLTDLSELLKVQVMHTHVPGKLTITGSNAIGRERVVELSPDLYADLRMGLEGLPDTYYVFGPSGLMPGHKPGSRSAVVARYGARSKVIPIGQWKYIGMRSHAISGQSRAFLMRQAGYASQYILRTALERIGLRIHDLPETDIEASIRQRKGQKG